MTLKLQLARQINGSGLVISVQAARAGKQIHIPLAQGVSEEIERLLLIEKAIEARVISPLRDRAGVSANDYG